MNYRLVFDIETIPDMQGLYKLELIAEKSDAAVDAYLKTRDNPFLPHHLQKVVAISCILEGFDPYNNQNIGIEKLHINSLCDLDASEEDIIRKFFQLIDTYTPQLVSWNGTGFDLPVLQQRALILGIEANTYWDLGERDHEKSKSFKWNNYISRYHFRHCDLMDVLALYQAKANVGLDTMARLCGLPGKLGMSGDQVWGAYQNGKLPEIRAYCETDVLNTYLLFKRFNAMRYQHMRQYPEILTYVQTYLKKLITEDDSIDQEKTKHWQLYLAKMLES